ARIASDRWPRVPRFPRVAAAGRREERVKPRGPRGRASYRSPMRCLLLAMLATLAGCTDRFLDIVPRETPLGAGLTGIYPVVIKECDPSDVYPDGCPEQYVLGITAARSRGDV